jgi:hypothetical protein
MANVFRTNGTETLEAVSFYTTGNNAEYEVRVYTGLSDRSKPNSGRLASVQRGRQTFSGYHTVVLDTAADLDAGMYFAVAVRVRTPGYLFPIPVEMKIGNLNYYLNASANPGESFLSSDGVEWEYAMASYGDVEESFVNVCVKAFTTNTGGYDGGDDGVNAEGGGGGCYTGVGAFAMTLSAVLAALRAHWRRR